MQGRAGRVKFARPLFNLIQGTIMKPLEERQKERAARMHMAKQETAVSASTRAELQINAEKAVVAADKEAGVKSAPLASQQKKAAAPVQAPAPAPAAKTAASPFGAKKK